MSTYREVMYMIFDELKLNSDDSYWNESHFAFMINKYRAILLKQKYDDLKREVPRKAYQTICLDLCYQEDCLKDLEVKSIEKVPSLLSLGDSTIRYDINAVYPDNSIDYYSNYEWTLISKDRMRFVGENQWLKKIIYFSIVPNNYLYVKSSGVNFKYLKKVSITGVFENPIEANKMDCNRDDTKDCDIYDFEFPLDEYLIPTLIGMMRNEFEPTIYKPEDKTNNADDDLSNLGIQNNN